MKIEIVEGLSKKMKGDNAYVKDAIAGKTRILGKKAEKSQLILIMTDTQRKDMIEVYGNPDMLTPNLDEKYEASQLDYDTGLPMDSAKRKK